MDQEIEKWVSLEEIAKHMGLSKDTIRNYIKKGQIPYYRIGKQYKFKISEMILSITLSSFNTKAF